MIDVWTQKTASSITKDTILNFSSVCEMSYYEHDDYAETVKNLDGEVNRQWPNEYESHYVPLCIYITDNIFSLHYNKVKKKKKMKTQNAMNLKRMN